MVKRRLTFRYVAFALEPALIRISPPDGPSEESLAPITGNCSIMSSSGHVAAYQADGAVLPVGSALPGIQLVYFHSLLCPLHQTAVRLSVGPKQNSISKDRKQRVI